MLSLFLDEDQMRRAVVRALRAGGVDVLTASEAGRRGLPDEDQLAFAAATGRVLCTCNVGDFARLHNRWMRIGRHHAGIILVRQQMAVGVQLGAVARLIQALDWEQMRDRLEFLTAWAASS